LVSRQLRHGDGAAHSVDAAGPDTKANARKDPAIRQREFDFARHKVGETVEVPLSFVRDVALTGLLV
jgi:hypothetical protein